MRLPPQPRDRLKILEERIEKAHQEGLFDNLRGAGKPLRRPERAFVPQDWRLAYDLLDEAGYAPDWIERDKSIRVELRDLEAERRRFVAGYERDPDPEARERFLEAHAGRLERVNREIELLNLELPRPLVWLQRPLVPVPQVLEAVRSACR